MVDDLVINYEPNPSGILLHTAHQQGGVICIGGPVGTGKSVTMSNELLRTAIAQTPYKGTRYTAFGVVRNTFPELKTTTIKTWLQWVPEELGKITYGSPIQHKIRFVLGDGSKVHSDVYFFAMDVADDVKKLKSFELTKIWFNEAAELSREFVDHAGLRLPRWPNKEMGGADEYGIIMDTNMPDEEHWMYKAFEEEKIPGWKMIHQPPAILKNMVMKGDKLEWDGTWIGNPKAENVQNVNGGFNYWLDQVHGKDPNFIRVMLEGKYGQTKRGKPVYEYEWNEEYHLADREWTADPELMVYTGWDWGLNPALIFAQIDRRGTLRALKELVPDSDCSLEAFLTDWVTPFKEQHFRGCHFSGWGDPAGIGRNPLDKSTPFQTVAGAGFYIKPTSTNTFVPRRDAVASFLKRLGGFTLNPSMKMLRKGFNGGYGYSKLGGGGGIYKDRPDKNEFSHPHDGLQYLCLGLVEQSKRKPAGSGDNPGAKGVSY